VDFEVEQSTQAIYIVISNIGATMARDVRLEFEPGLSSSLDSRGDITSPSDLKPLRDGIPSLPPGKRLPVMFDMFTQRAEAIYPDVYRVTITFYAPALKHELRDESVLDLGMYRNVLHANRRDVHDVHERLKELVTEARKWSASGGGLLTLDPSQLRSRTADTIDFSRARGPLPRRLLYRIRIRLRRLLNG
jgi:hypothetical protein